MTKKSNLGLNSYIPYYSLLIPINPFKGAPYSPLDVLTPEIIFIDLNELVISQLGFA